MSADVYGNPQRNEHSLVTLNYPESANQELQQLQQPSEIVASRQTEPARGRPQPVQGQTSQPQGLPAHQITQNGPSAQQNPGQGPAEVPQVTPQGPHDQQMPQQGPLTQQMPQPGPAAGAVATPPNNNGTFIDLSGSSMSVKGGFSHADTTPEMMGSIFDPVAAHIPIKIKEKIWKGEFISLSILLKSARDLANDSSMDGEFVMRGGVLTLVNKKPEQIYNINTWTSAFIIFMSIVLEKRPNKAQELLKYMQSVRFAASRCGNNNWVQYDEQYRLKKGNYPDSSWGIIDQELWVLFVATDRSNPDVAASVSRQVDQPTSTYNANHQSQQSNFRPPQGNTFRTTEASRQDNKCFKFNSGNYCRFGRSCRFEHKCSKCNGGHPATKCKKRF